MLQSLIQQRISRPEIARKLDAEMLALLVEERDRATDPEALSAILGNSLFAVQTERASIDPAPMWSVMANTSTAIAQGVPDEETRAVFAATGLSAVSCTRIAAHVADHLTILAQTFGDESTPLQPLAALMIRGLAPAREMEPRYEFSGSADELLRGWLNGDTVAVMAQNLEVDPMTLTRYAEDYFGYRMPWGMSAYLQIAAHALGLSEIPVHLQNLPVLVRYGVPRVSAAWAMSLGVQSRNVAQRMGATYESDTTSPSSGSLRRWLSRLEPEELGEQFGLPAETAALASRAVMRAHGNEALRVFYSSDGDLYPIRIRIRMRATVSSLLEPAHLAGRALMCVRDYDSPNRNAVLLFLGEQEVARLPRTVGDVIALDIDSGSTLAVRVIEFDDGGAEIEIADMTPDL